MNIYLTTDTHFGHKKIIEYGRPKDFEERIKKYLKNTIHSDDLLIHLGDVCIGNDIANNKWFKENLKCKTYLLRGNHDKKSLAWYMDNGWDVVADRIDIEMFGKKICFSHMPIAWDGYFDINIHGHFHDSDHRRLDPEFNKILCGYNKLLALEYTNYQSVNLRNFIK
ncbi:MAG: metallophosphoesterase [Negativicutes bacterium]|nr:metallophosphoesterase [Negativicutes bacterium]